jgi:Gluconate 2-dehydrogenase subunit 3
MNRRKAISVVALTGFGAALAGGAYTWWSFARTPDLPWLHQNHALLDALGETIIPGNDTPGAKTANITDFIIRMVSDCTPRKEQNTFLSGLQDLQTYCHHHHSLPFEQCDPATQTTALAVFEKKDQPYAGIAGKLQTRLAGRSFFNILKDYTVYGYCTSQTGATKGLAYVYIPGAYKACTPLQPGQKAWATS